MCCQLIHVYGPISIHSYGVMIFLGLLLVFVLMLHDPMRKKIMNSEKLVNVIGFGLLSGLLGARILYLVCNWRSINTIWDILALWDGGLSLMGAVVGILVGVPFYLRYNNILVLPCLDIFAVYIPLLQAISRIGCFLAGCCYGCPTKTSWGIYSRGLNSECVNQLIHPVQLYSTGIQLLIFVFLFWFRKKLYTRPGQLISLYLILASLERFIIDFWRGDREFFPQEMLGFFSIHQVIALIIAGFSVTAFFVFSSTKNK